MLAKLTHEAWSSRPKLSVVFWGFTILVYATGAMAVLAILSPELNDIALKGNTAAYAAFKLNSVRLPIICAALVVFPVLLWTLPHAALVFLKIFTAGTIVMYIDDQLVLYDVLDYPDLPLVQTVLFLRLILIIGLVWMCFELNFRLKQDR